VAAASFGGGCRASGEDALLNITPKCAGGNDTKGATVQPPCRRTTTYDEAQATDMLALRGRGVMSSSLVLRALPTEKLTATSSSPAHE
jgi:hypothetical protein